MAQTSDETLEESLVFYAHKPIDIYFPIRSSVRVKYTSFHVCPSYIAFGSSSGGVYLFAKCGNGSYDYLFTILNADNCGPITCVAFADNDDHLIAMSTSRGHVMIAEIGVERQVLYNCPWNIIYQSSSFTKSAINILKWDQYYSYRLYISDDSGQTFVLHNVKDMKNLMVLPMPSIILKLNVKIFQLDVCMDLMLISTQYRYVLYDLSCGELTQIGKKSVRAEGQYGVCFYPNDNRISDHNCIFCSRPKSRLWECDLKGNVRFTHQFKELVINQMPQKIINGHNICYLNQLSDNTSNTDNNRDRIGTEIQTHSPTFAKLCVMNSECLDESLIVTFSNRPNTCLYIINPINACIVSYCILNVNHIQDMYCIESDIYIIYNANDDKRLRLSKISLLSCDQCLQLLAQDYNESESAANFVINHFQYFSSNRNKRQTKSHFRTDKILQNLWLNLKSDDKQRFQQIQQLIIKPNDENSVIGKSHELFLNSIDSNTSDLYNRQLSDGQYYDIDSHFTRIESTIDGLDLGFTELNKLKDIVLSKLTSNQIDFKPNLEPLLSVDSNAKQLADNDCSLENNRINSVVEHKDKTEDNKRNDLKVVLNSLEMELESSQTLHKYKCDCNSPLPGSHLNQNEFQAKIRLFLDKNMHFMKYSVMDLMEISGRNGIWTLYMELVLNCEDYKKYMKLCLMLNEVKLLLNENIQNYLFCSENLEQLLIQFAEQRDVGSDQIVRCIECNKSVTNTENSIKWEIIIKFCIKAIGVDEALLLFRKFIHKKPNFSSNFYLLLLRMRMISVYQSPVTRDKLNKLMTHLNSVSKVRSSVAQLSSKPTSNSSSSTKTSITPNECKGFKINICNEKCAKCNTSLITKNNTKSSEKLVAFYCKHIYHKSCLTSVQNYCILCDKTGIS